MTMTRDRVFFVLVGMMVASLLSMAHDNLSQYAIDPRKAGAYWAGGAGRHQEVEQKGEHEEPAAAGGGEEAIVIPSSVVETEAETASPLPSSSEPIFVMNLPKDGTDDIYDFFECGNVKTSKGWAATKDGTILRVGSEWQKRIVEERPLLQGFDDSYKVWINTGVPGDDQREECFYPSFHAHESIAEHYPRATIMQVVGNSQHWLDAVKQWTGGSLMRKWGRFCSDFPNEGSTDTDWLAFYDRHSALVRKFAVNHPTLQYIEVPASAATTPSVLEEKTSIQESCWKRSKKQAEETQQKSVASVVSFVSATEPNRRTPNYINGTSLPAPVFVMSLPKSGTSSVFSFFRCGGVKASHGYAELAPRNVTRVGEVWSANVKAGRPLLENSGNYDVWTDEGIPGVSGKVECFYPSFEALDNIYHYYPHATIMLAVREKKAWLDSLKRWSGGSLMSRWQKTCNDFPDLGAKDEDWLTFYDAHTEHVRSEYIS